MVERNTVIGVDLLVVGFVVSGLGYTLAQSVPIAALGFAIAIIGALLLLLVPDPVPRDAYRALLEDSIRNVEMILEESSLHERAYFTQMEDGRVRALVPLTAMQAAVGGGPISAATLHELGSAPRRFVVDFRGVRGLMLVPPGAQMVELARVEKGGDLEDSLRSVLVDLSDLASSVLAVEEEGSNTVRVQIAKPKLSSDSPFFENCLGSPASCVAGCVATVVKGRPVRILEEKRDPALVRLTLEVIA